MRTRELIVTGIIVIFFLICYFVITEPIQFSPTVSLIIIILMVLVFLWILVLTLQGKFIERRIVFILVGISLLLPLFMQFDLPIRISDEVRGAFESLEKLPPGSRILASFDYDPASAPELQPMADAFVAYAFEHDLKLIIMGLWPQGPQQAQQAVEAAFIANPALRDKITYGVDYVNLGFQAGNEFVILRMGESFKAAYPLDMVENRPYDSIPLLANVKNFSNIDFSMNFSAGKPGTVEWIQIAVDRYDLEMAAGNTAVQAPMAYPYLKAGQITGLLGGMAGAAEFEKLTGKTGKATTYLLSQSSAHMVVMAFIVIGNIAYFRQKKGKK